MLIEQQIVNLGMSAQYLGGFSENFQQINS
jgi:hypothetical protein